MFRQGVVRIVVILFVVIFVVPLGAVLFLAASVLARGGLHHSALPPTRTETLHLGQVATLASPPDDGSGIATVTVAALADPVTAADPKLVPDPGKRFAVADIQVCAGPEGARATRDSYRFSVVLAEGGYVNPIVRDATTPGLRDVKVLGPNQCARGYLTFHLRPANTPALVTFQPGRFVIY